jgi:hypothetical protein
LITRWECPACSHKEKTSPCVQKLIHIHGGKEVELTPFRKAMKKRGVDTVKSLKVKAWDVFSEWVRRSASDEDGYCGCVTCGKIDHWKNMQAGHYIHGTLFLIPELVHPQCPVCNGFKAGMAVEYKEYMIKRYGENKVAELTYKAKNLFKKLSIFELQQYIKLYTEKLKEL